MWCISIHAPHAGSDYYEVFYNRRTDISIHAPHAGSDNGNDVLLTVRDHFNPRSPCGERRPCNGTGKNCLWNFNPRSPCGERRYNTGAYGRAINFNPRSPCGERPAAMQKELRDMEFQSTLPMRGATMVSTRLPPNNKISIHAPHAGSDISGPLPPSTPSNFNPRSPCGERQGRRVQEPTGWQFQSTLPMRGATKTTNNADRTADFNPRSPCGERRGPGNLEAPGREFQSTLPMRGATKLPIHGTSEKRISIHAPHAGSD